MIVVIRAALTTGNGSVADKAARQWFLAFNITRRHPQRLPIYSGFFAFFGWEKKKNNSAKRR